MHSRNTHRSACEQTKDRLNEVREKESWLLCCVWAREHGAQKCMEKKWAMTAPSSSVVAVFVCKNFSIQCSIFNPSTHTCSQQPTICPSLSRSLSFSLLWVQPKCQNQSLDVSTNCGCVPTATSMLLTVISSHCHQNLESERNIFANANCLEIFLKLCIYFTFLYSYVWIGFLCCDFNS